MEIGMLNFWLGLLVTALTKETYFNEKIPGKVVDIIAQHSRLLLFKIKIKVTYILEMLKTSHKHCLIGKIANVGSQT